LLVGTGVDGLYGRSERFERITTGIEALVTALGRRQGATLLRFPPVLARPAFARTGYLSSFPDLVGDVYSFTGGDAEHGELLRRLESGQPWDDLLKPSEVVLSAAACHPLYPTLSSPVPEEGACYDVLGWVFRHEPSVDPARLVAFRQHELVYVGDAAGARAHRDRALAEAVALLDELGVEVSSTVASDPFFGRAGRLLRANQRGAGLKYEVLAPTSGSTELTAIVSVNYHEDHFGTAFDLRTPGGGPAHTACVGYGLERTALALIWAHGPDPDAWPAPLRATLWP
jgi:seryl-tRNA synthetase